MEIRKESQVYVGLELKYCERCGGLWLRPRGSPRIYCRPCFSIMVEILSLRAQKGEPRRASGELDTQTEVTEIRELMAFCADGGVA
jgi:hypothetical protein